MIREAFARAGAKPEGSSGIDFVEAVLRERPDLKDKTAVFPGQGQKGHTVIIGNEVFKGPRQNRGECMDDFITECKTLKALEGNSLTTAVPAMTTEGRDFLFFGMSKVPGVMMGSDYASRLSSEEQKALAKDLVNFTIELAHALPVQNGKFAMHDDLYYNNIFIDPETKRLSGVIDFGIVKYKTAAEWTTVSDFKGTKFGQLMQDEFNRRKADLPANVAIDTLPFKAVSGFKRLLAAAWGA